MDKAKRLKTLAATASLLLVLEGVSYVPYRDIGGVWTIGAGSTGPDITDNTPRWTHAQVLERTGKDAEKFMAGVLKCLASEPTEGQLIAFTSLAYNVGLGAPGRADGFCYLKSGRLSTVVRRYNSGDKLGACLAIFQWVNVKGKYSQGLHNRREQEYQLCIA